MRLFGLSLALGGCFKLKSVLKVFFNGLHGEAHNEALPNPSHVGEWEERFPTTTQPPPNPFLKGTINEAFKEMSQKFVESMFSTNSAVLPIRAQKFVESMFSTNSAVLPIRAQKFVESMFSTKTYALIEV